MSAASGLHTTRDRRRDTIDRAVRVAFGKAHGLHGSPRLVWDLREDGWTVTEKTVADSMRRRTTLRTCRSRPSPQPSDLLGVLR